jgi:ABC-type cobalamin/Fe3+-siderophores transport system ATPase subunit
MISFLLGRNGSGNLLYSKSGIETADFKFVRIDGIVKNKTKDLFQELSYLSQENFIPNHFTVAKAISLTIDKIKGILFYEDEIRV